MPQELFILHPPTEREEGLGANAVRSNYDRRVVRDFTLDFSDHRKPPAEHRNRPSDSIIDSALAYAGDGGEA